MQKPGFTRYTFLVSPRRCLEERFGPAACRSARTSVRILLTVALGFGRNVSVHEFARPLTRPDVPYESPDRIVSIFGSDPIRGVGAVSYAQYLLLKRATGAFEWVGAASVSPATLLAGNQSGMAFVAAVTPDVAAVLQLPLGIGAGISRRTWQEEFSGRPGVLGRQIQIHGVKTVVGGLAPKWLVGLYRDRPIDIWIALNDDSQTSGAKHNIDDGRRNFWPLARLHHNVFAGQAQSSVRRILYSRSITCLLVCGPDLIGPEAQSQSPGPLTWSPHPPQQEAYQHLILRFGATFNALAPSHTV